MLEEAHQRDILLAEYNSPQGRPKEELEEEYIYTAQEVNTAVRKDDYEQDEEVEFVHDWREGWFEATSKAVWSNPENANLIWLPFREAATGDLIWHQCIYTLETEEKALKSKRKWYSALDGIWTLRHSVGGQPPRYRDVDAGELLIVRTEEGQKRLTNDIWNTGIERVNGLKNTKGTNTKAPKKWKLVLVAPGKKIPNHYRLVSRIKRGRATYSRLR